MDEYVHTDRDGDSIAIGNGCPIDHVSIIVTQLGDRSVAYIAKADVPTFASELLKAAGHDNLADLVGWESAEKKLQERRERRAELRKRLNFGHYDCKKCVKGEIDALDYIIELEDGK